MTQIVFQLFYVKFFKFVYESGSGNIFKFTKFLNRNKFKVALYKKKLCKKFREIKIFIFITLIKT